MIFCLPSLALEVLRHPDRLDDLLELPLGGPGRGPGRGPRVEQAGADQLLGDRRGAAARAAQRVEPGGDDRRRVEAGVLPERLVLDRGRGIEQDRRDLVEGDDLALEVAEPGELDLAGPVVDDDLLGELVARRGSVRVGEVRWPARRRRRRTVIAPRTPSAARNSEDDDRECRCQPGGVGPRPVAASGLDRAEADRGSAYSDRGDRYRMGTSREAAGDTAGDRRRRCIAVRTRARVSDGRRWRRDAGRVSWRATPRPRSVRRGRGTAAGGRRWPRAVASSSGSRDLGADERVRGQGAQCHRPVARRRRRDRQLLVGLDGLDEAALLGRERRERRWDGRRRGRSAPGSRRPRRPAGPGSRRRCGRRRPGRRRRRRGARR